MKNKFVVIGVLIVVASAGMLFIIGAPLMEPDAHHNMVHDSAREPLSRFVEIIDNAFTPKILSYEDNIILGDKVCIMNRMSQTVHLTLPEIFDTTSLTIHGGQGACAVLEQFGSGEITSDQGEPLIIDISE